METILKHYKVKKKDISYIKFIYEAYDGIAVITTLDQDSGLIVLRIAPDYEAEAEAVMKALKKKFLIESVEGNIDQE